MLTYQPLVTIPENPVYSLSVGKHPILATHVNNYSFAATFQDKVNKLDKIILERKKSRDKYFIYMC